MSLLLRFAFFFVLAGFVLGLLLRRAYPERLPEVILISALPWLVHLGYALFRAFGSYSAVLGGTVFGLLDVGMAAFILRAGPRLYRRDTRRAALLPLLLLLGHFFLLGTWALLGDVLFPALPNLYFIAATLLVAAGLLGYGWPRPRGIVRRR